MSFDRSARDRSSDHPHLDAQCGATEGLGRRGGGALALGSSHTGDEAANASNRRWKCAPGQRPPRLRRSGQTIAPAHSCAGRAGNSVSPSEPSAVLLREFCLRVTRLPSLRAQLAFAFVSLARTTTTSCAPPRAGCSWGPTPTPGLGSIRAGGARPSATCTRPSCSRTFCPRCARRAAALRGFPRADRARWPKPRRPGHSRQLRVDRLGGRQAAARESRGPPRRGLHLSIARGDPPSSRTCPPRTARP